MGKNRVLTNLIFPSPHLIMIYDDELFLKHVYIMFCNCIFIISSIKLFTLGRFSCHPHSSHI